MAFNLPRFINTLSIANDDGTPTVTFHRWWDEILRRIEDSINNIQAAIDAADAAQTAADTAQAAADTAQTAVDGVESVAKLGNSGISGLTLSATDAGSDASITISGHTRLYGDGTSVSVTGNTLTGLSYSTKYYIYYDDSGFAGGAVSYASTTTDTTAAQTGNRHLVGSITTPAAAAADTSGNNVAAPGLSTILEP